MASMTFSEGNDRVLIKQFIDEFWKMFNETKYNLRALNKRFDFIEKCFTNIMLLNSNEPYAEEEEDIKDNEELKIAQADLDYINEHYISDDNKSKELIENDNNEDDEKEENEYVPTGVKPEKKVGKYTEFLKFKELTNLNKGKGNRKPSQEKSDDSEDLSDYIGKKRNRSNKSSSKNKKK